MESTASIRDIELSDSQIRWTLGPVLGLSAICIVWLLLTVATISLAGLTIRSFLIVADVCVLLFPLIAKVARGTFDFFEPILVSNTTLLAMMVGRPIADIANQRFIEHGYDFSSSFTYALLVVLVGNLCFQLGYFSPWRITLANSMPRPSYRFDVNKVAAWGTTIALIGVSLYSIFLATQGGVALLLTILKGRSATDGAAHVASSGYIYGGSGLLVPAAIIFFGIWVVYRRKRYLVGAMLTGLPYMVLVSAHGDRSMMIALIFGVPMLWFLGRGTRPSPQFVFASIFILASIFGFMRTHRNAKTSAIDNNKFDIVQSGVSIFQSDDDEMFDVTALEIEVVPSLVEWKPFGVVTDVIARGLPRQFFPDKGVEMDQNFFATMWPARAKASKGGTATSIIGDFYLDSGLWTVAFWMYVLGLIFGASWSWYLANEGSVTTLLIFAIVPSVIVNVMRGSFATLLGWGFFSFFPLLLLPFIQRIQWRSYH